MITDLNNPAELERLIKTETALLVYFSTNTCSVCKSLKPKVEQAVEHHFSKLKAVYVKSDDLPEAAAQHRVFTAPTLLVFFEGKETLRKIRNFSVDELIREISRSYSLIFSE